MLVEHWCAATVNERQLLLVELRVSRAGPVNDGKEEYALPAVSPSHNASIAKTGSMSRAAGTGGGREVVAVRGVGTPCPTVRSVVAGDASS
ncbi:hypothetical protein [Micromonospora sp. AMSO12t]|uniref:hypothetical protein n=1 Tax=Micromonospora sp. AMSO12t TaxID=2650410 RepID=UPI00124B20D3|nr:hypothetical protein [Micromonospora sp. AMSO12t]